MPLFRQSGIHLIDHKTCQTYFWKVIRNNFKLATIVDKSLEKIV